MSTEPGRGGKPRCLLRAARTRTLAALSSVDGGFASPSLLRLAIARTGRRSRRQRVHQRALCEPPPRVLLYSKPGCHLCDEARVVVAEVCRELGETYDEVDITTSPDLRARYGEEIPVTFVDGEQHDYWRVDPERLRTALLRGV